jgi:hypothetical protein
VRGGKGAALPGRDSRNGGGGGGVEQKNRGKEGRSKTTGLICNFPKFQGPVCKPAITFKLGLKRKSVQNESCKTFQALQLCFRV